MNAVRGVKVRMRIRKPIAATSCSRCRSSTVRRLLQSGPHRVVVAQCSFERLHVQVLLQTGVAELLGQCLFFVDPHVVNDWVDLGRR